MKRKTYTITGTNDVGYRVTVPKIMGLVSGDKLVCEIVDSETLTYRVERKAGTEGGV